MDSWCWSRTTPCGPGALKVKDIPEGTKPKLPKIWPGLPILIDSPDYCPAIDASTVETSGEKMDLQRSVRRRLRTKARFLDSGR